MPIASSAYILGSEEDKQLGRLFTYYKKSKGPCGISLVTKVSNDLQPLLTKQV